MREHGFPVRSDCKNLNLLLFQYDMTDKVPASSPHKISRGGSPLSTIPPHMISTGDNHYTQPY
ncbi:hypothetical protein J6590_070297 [Homalodisca vitripennis]|nr:hypothetical protein J6590_070297 [Homalodisca vitripennis]